MPATATAPTTALAGVRPGAGRLYLYSAKYDLWIECTQVAMEARLDRERGTYVNRVYVHTRDYGVHIITEARWLDMIQRGYVQARPEPTPAAVSGLFD